MAASNPNSVQDLQCIQSKSTTQFVIPEPDTLNGLPLELIISISDLLEPEDMLCLSMCNRRLFGALSCKRKLLPSTEYDKLEVPCRLERDLPNHFLCWSCEILHKFDRPEWYTVSDRYSEWPSRLPCASRWEAYREGLHSEIRSLPFREKYAKYSSSLQSVMRYFYCGVQYGVGTESLYHTQVSKYLDATTLFSIEPRVYQEQKEKGLCIQIQEILLVYYVRMGLFIPKPPFPDRSSPYYFWICEHFSRREMRHRVKSILSAYLSDTPMSPLRGNCDKCNTDFELQMEEVRGRLALIFTKWIILGPGAKPDDPDWGKRDRKSILQEPDFQAIDMAVSPRASFETACETSIEALRSRNLSYLRKRRYKELMMEVPGGYDIWVLPRY
ncbi:unnamed protein product [Penicillium nalgiovense]|uniref:F-box domain-containing protein n=1 Tax=Penicillium nalgiovense TaxID=60175 RepID=A0A9W4I1H1_PENNA|nr:unnamed protein product [Penicillium nalgiovense]CAG7978087.1 unnamed protein product [Penicillium nalgiovense]CAG7979283.1 unnamed protein product [Penicillium nalgiovense]CAG7990194.1 unnamed protein product [Penicillium nalgiovense]CAG8070474.1 unnamed protein product [Penicillium nalgiovense]